jgi:uncharacterized short protein YbdD (DUF466 family)
MLAFMKGYNKAQIVSLKRFVVKPFYYHIESSKSETSVRIMSALFGITEYSEYVNSVLNKFPPRIPQIKREMRSSRGVGGWFKIRN